MGAAQYANDAAFGPRRGTGCAVRANLAALDASDDAIAVHRIAHLIRRYKKIAVEIFSRRIGHDKAISIAMSHQTSGEQIGIARGRLRRCRAARDGLWEGAALVRRSGEAIMAAAQLLDQPLSLQARENRFEGAPPGVTQGQTGGNLPDRNRSARSAEKIQDVFFRE